jgi:hypothetical protein
VHPLDTQPSAHLSPSLLNHLTISTPLVHSPTTQPSSCLSLPPQPLNHEHASLSLLNHSIISAILSPPFCMSNHQHPSSPLLNYPNASTPLSLTSVLITNILSCLPPKCPHCSPFRCGRGICPVSNVDSSKFMFAAVISMCFCIMFL